MRRTSIFVAAIAAIALVGAVAEQAPAQVQTKGQQGCINAVNKDGAKVAATQGKENAACVKNAGKGKLGALLPQDCLTNDGKGKVAKAAAKTIADESAKCVETPDFGLTDAATINAAAVNGELALMASVFGADLTPAIIDAGVDKVGAGCQSAVVKSFEKLAATRAKEFVGCKKAGLKEETITNVTELSACAGADAKGKVAKAADKVGAAIDKKCVGVDTDLAFPGDCVGEPDFGDCVAAVAQCETCKALAVIDGFAPSICDQLDDGLLNDSCGACGNGIVSGLEECDDGDNLGGDGCSAVCTCGVGSGEFGCQEPTCPDKGELILLAGTGPACATNGDCLAGVCDSGGLGRCITATELDAGWTGISHDSDINDQVTTVGNLVCPGPGPTCGVCSVGGINPEPGNCRCAGANQTICDEPFQADYDDCGGSVCNCYLGPPLPLSAGNTPACVVNAFAQDVTGTADVDAGSGVIDAKLSSRVYLGITIDQPCPYCTGDVTIDDGVRDGTCVGGVNNGLSCDANGISETFPAPGGDAHSLDCLPDVGKNVSGTGLKLTLTQTTGSVSLPSAVECGFPPSVIFSCPCGVCEGDSLQPCSSNGDCALVGGACKNPGGVKPNACSDGVCTAAGGDEGACLANAPDSFCDAIVRANGKGFISCSTNGDCAVGAIGIAAGNCTLSGTRECFLDPIVAAGTADPSTPVGVAALCIPATSNGGINSVAGLPGPARIVNQVAATTFCASAPGTPYVPGVGGCP